MILLSLFFSLFIQNQSIEEVVISFHAVANKKAETTFINRYENSQNADILGYVYALKMKRSKYSFNPYVKIKNFMEVRKNLKKLIEKNPNSIHLRYIRLLLQESTPEILGYKDSIEEDKMYLSKVLQNKETNYLSQYIYKNTSL